MEVNSDFLHYFGIPLLQPLVSKVSTESNEKEQISDLFLNFGSALGVPRPHGNATG